MKQKIFFSLSLSFLLMFSLSACSSTVATEATESGLSIPETAVPEMPVQEVPVQLLTLDSPLDTPTAEISGLTWAGDWLIVLPQYPTRFGDKIFRINKADILTAIETDSVDPLPMETIDFDSDRLEKDISHFEGFESITTDGTTVYMTIESSPNKMLGYAVRGEFSDDFSKISLDADSLVELPARANLSNLTDESILLFGKRLVTLYEANGANVNPDPTAYLLSLDLKIEDTLPFPTIEYRVTDASSVDEAGRFWVINYMYPGDAGKLNPAEDIYALEFGEGETQSQSDVVERLLELQFTEDGIVPSGCAPIQLLLMPDGQARNWEGLVRLDDLGFLVASDTHPDTLLGFIPYP